MAKKLRRNNMTNKSIIRRKIRDAAKELIAFGCIGFKTGKEAESQGIEEIGWIKETLDIVPITCKVSGQEAITDLMELRSIGINIVVFPMIETPFGLRKSIQAAQHVADGNKPFEISINLESVEAFRNRMDIFNCAEIAHVSKINIGKTDLAASLGLKPNDDQILQACQVFKQLARDKNIKFGIGGKIEAASIEHVLEIVQPDEVETRHVIFDVKKMTHPREAIESALKFEMLLSEGWLENLQKENLDLSMKIRKYQERLATGIAFGKKMIEAKLERISSKIRFNEMRINQICKRIVEVNSRRIPPGNAV